MSIFTFLKRKREQKKAEDGFEQISVEEALKKYAVSSEETKEDILALVQENCNQIEDIRKQLKDTKREYDGVTIYLNDIQKIDQIEEKKRETITEAAEAIIKLEAEQKQAKEENNAITDFQYHNIAQFEADIERELASLKEQEKFQTKVKDDLRQLEGEKGVQKYEIRRELSKKGFLKQLSIISLVIIFLIFMLLLFLMQSSETQFEVPFFMTGIFSVSLIFYIVWAGRKSAYNLKIAQNRLNRSIVLLNKVKIRYVNCTASIDYIYEKYHVNSSQDLFFQYEEYKKIKKRMEKMQKNNSKLKYYQGLLIKELRKYHIEDTECWCYQAQALLDKKEMVEVRHRLNVRRQKLRERMDYNTDQMDLAMNALMGIRTRHPEYEQEIRQLMIFPS